MVRRHQRVRHGDEPRRHRLHAPRQTPRRHRPHEPAHRLRRRLHERTLRPETLRRIPPRRRRPLHEPRLRAHLLAHPLLPVAAVLPLLLPHERRPVGTPRRRSRMGRFGRRFRRPRPFALRRQFPHPPAVPGRPLSHAPRPCRDRHPGFRAETALSALLRPRNPRSQRRTRHRPAFGPDRLRLHHRLPRLRRNRRRPFPPPVPRPPLRRRTLPRTLRAAMGDVPAERLVLRRPRGRHARHRPPRRVFPSRRGGPFLPRSPRAGPPRSRRSRARHPLPFPANLA